MASKNCVFCDIYNGKTTATVSYKDNDVIIFDDIHPAAKIHFLVVPKEHIPNAKQLTKDQTYIVEKLVEEGKRLIESKGGNLNDTRLGFHWPPFNSISHLHLHVMYPASELSFFSKIVFKENSLWFVKPEYVLERLSKL